MKNQYLLRVCFFLMAIITVPYTSKAWQSGEAYYVTHVKGAVTLVATGKKLVLRDKISPSDKVKFSSNEDLVVVISSTKGRMVLKPVSSKEEQGELMYFVRENLIPMQKHTSSRGGAAEFFSEKEIKDYFGDQSFLVLEDNPFWLSKDIFSFEEGSHLFVRYQIGDKQVQYKPDYDANTQQINIQRKELLTFEGKTINPASARGFTLFYYDSFWDNAIEVTPMELSFVDEERLLDEIEMIKNYEGAGKEGTRQNIYSYVRFVYGNYHEASLDKLIDK